MELTLAERESGIGRQVELLLATSFGPTPTVNQIMILNLAAWPYQTGAGNTKETMSNAFRLTIPFARGSRMLL